MTALTVAALFVRADSIYKTMPAVDAWDEQREHTPPALAEWLVELARRCRVREEIAA